MVFSGVLRRNVLILAVCQALMLSGSSLVIATSALVGKKLASSEMWATLPISFMFIGTLLATFPASLMMRRIGRRAGFMIGPAIGLVGTAIAALAIMWSSFSLFSLGSFLIGVFNGVGYYYRFAAVDGVADSYRSRAISWVLAGGVLAAFIGPNMANWNQDLIAGFPFAGSYLSLIALYIVSIVMAAMLRLPMPSVEERSGIQRPLSTIARQPIFLVAVIGAVVAYGVMNLLMTSTPLAMAGHGHSFSDTALVIEWHVVAMFLPSFVTGNLIARFGVSQIMGAGVLLLLGSVSVSLHGVSVLHFIIALALLGVGWNFLFVGGTTLVTDSYAPAEKAKTQGLNDFLVFGTVALTAAGSGFVHHWAGWDILNLVVVPPLALSMGALIWFARRRAAV